MLTLKTIVIEDMKENIHYGKTDILARISRLEGVKTVYYNGFYSLCSLILVLYGEKRPRYYQIWIYGSR